MIPHWQFCYDFAMWSTALVPLALLAAMAIYYLFYRDGAANLAYRFGRNKTPAPPDTDQSSAIISFFTAGHGIMNGGHGTLNNMAYSLYLTTPDAPNVNAPAGIVAELLNPRSMPAANSIESARSFTSDLAIIYQLDLPFNTQTHVVGLSKSFGFDRLSFESLLRYNSMKKVVLEGDFRDYFDLYAPPDQQLQVRYTLDPAAMQYVVEFCRSHFWEINGAEMYIAISTGDKRDDVNFIAESQRFVEQIRPALLPGGPGAPSVYHAAAYGVMNGPALCCPICRQTMNMTADYQACPAGHGILINATGLERLHNHELTVLESSGGATSHQTLVCPSCHNPMSPVNFEGGPVVIDSCTNCLFRWLDAGEATRIAGGKVQSIPAA